MVILLSLFSFSFFSLLFLHFRPFLLFFFSFLFLSFCIQSIFAQHVWILNFFSKNLPHNCSVINQYSLKYYFHVHPNPAMSIQLSKFMWCIRNGMKAVEQKYCFDFATHLCHFSLFLFTNFHFCSYILFFDIWSGKLLLAQPKTNEKSFKKLIENSMTHQIHKKLQETKWRSLWWSHKYRFNFSSCDQRAQTSERLKSTDNCVVFYKWAQIGFRSSCIQKWIWNILTFVHKRININVLSWQFCNFVDVLSAKLWKRAKKKKQILNKT